MGKSLSQSNFCDFLAIPSSPYFESLFVIRDFKNLIQFLLVHLTGIGNATLSEDNQEFTLYKIPSTAMDDFKSVNVAAVQNT
uniref:Uncharacterized protein n=1 Tax=Daphnia galeata TaxID=27404 RepID=A0A8J2RIY5_9CRUS|nr:unnamed protein product [Daphnia galeata]